MARRCVVLVMAVVAALGLAAAPSGADTETVASASGGGWTVTVADSPTEMDATSGMVARLYLGLMGREAEPAGLAYWYEQADAGMTPGRVAEHFLKSTEFMVLEGEAGDAFIGALYRNVLAREPDQQGHSYWLGQWDLGGRDVQAAAAIALQFTSSPEFTEQVTASGYFYPYIRRTSAVQAASVEPIPDADLGAYTRQIFPPDQWRNVELIVACESSWRPDAVNVNTDGLSTVDLGLFQINTYYQARAIAENQHYFTQRSRDLYAEVGLDAALLDPYFNIEVAYMITQVEDWRAVAFPASSFRSGRWGSWTCASPAHNPALVFWPYALAQ